MRPRRLLPAGSGSEDFRGSKSGELVLVGDGTAVWRTASVKRVKLRLATHIGVAHSSSGLARPCNSAIVPDPSITPGAVRTTDAAEICSRGTRELRRWDQQRSDRIMCARTAGRAASQLRS